MHYSLPGWVFAWSHPSSRGLRPKKDGNVNFRIFRAYLLRRWYLALAFMGVSAAAGLFAAPFVPLDYTATMVVTAARYSDDAKPSDNSTGISLLQSLNTQKLSDFGLYLLTLDSLRVAGALFQDHPELVHQVFEREWQRDHWAPSDSLAFAAKSDIYRLFDAKPWAPPTPFDLAQFLQRAMKIDKDFRDPVATVSITLPDRALAISLLTAVHEEAERILKEDARKRAAAKVRFMDQLAAQSQKRDVQQSIGDLLLRDILADSLADAPIPFAADFISSPDAPLRPSVLPRMVFLLVFGIGGGLGLAACAFFLETHWVARPAARYGERVT